MKPKRVQISMRPYHCAFAMLAKKEQLRTRKSQRTIKVLGQSFQEYPCTLFVLYVIESIWREAYKDKMFIGNPNVFVEVFRDVFFHFALIFSMHFAVRASSIINSFLHFLLMALYIRRTYRLLDRGSNPDGTK